MSDIAGLLVLDQPAGVTSFHCVSRVRKAFGLSRVGHCGTLDPLARGVLLILLGPATRRQDEMMQLRKQYWFKAAFGQATATGDREGVITRESSYDSVSETHLKKTLKDFTGEIEQIPPMYSALKFKGKHYYDYARKGITIPRTARRVTVHSLDLLNLSLPLWEGRLQCSRGTYVRTLVEDVAERMGTCGMLVDLVREQIGPYSRQDALSLEDLDRYTSEDLRSRLHA